MFQEINQVVELMNFNSISDHRKLELQPLIDYILDKRQKSESIKFNFICTHNSRRSQFAQVWALVAADKYQIPIESFSGGNEVTECNIRTIQSLQRFGFQIESAKGINPKHQIKFDEKEKDIELYSKMYDDESNPKSEFAAVMTCSNADENCPFISGCEKRISMNYEDPKNFDDTILESVMYDSRSFQIATEMMFVFSKSTQDDE